MSTAHTMFQTARQFIEWALTEPACNLILAFDEASVSVSHSADAPYKQIEVRGYGLFPLKNDDINELSLQTVCILEDVHAVLSCKPYFEEVIKCECKKAQDSMMQEFEQREREAYQKRREAIGLPPLADDEKRLSWDEPMRVAYFQKYKTWSVFQSEWQAEADRRRAYRASVQAKAREAVLNISTAVHELLKVSLDANVIRSCQVFISDVKCIYVLLDKIMMSLGGNVMIIENRTGMREVFTIFGGGGRWM